MKKATVILILASALPTGCATSGSVFTDEQRAEISWSSFCTARGYDLNDNTCQTTNEYLDTWCGSAEEEAALINAGVESH